MTPEPRPVPLEASGVPARLLELCPFPPDYVDAFVAPVCTDSPPPAERWARAAMERAPAAGRFLAWRAVCHLRLTSERSHGTIAGWRIADRGDDWIRVEASSWFMTATVVFALEQGRLWFVTFVRYDHPAGRLVWGPASGIHRAVAPAFLAHGVRRIERSQRAAHPATSAA